MTEAKADQVLVKKVQQGDSRAFDLLVLKYQPKVQSIISRFLNKGAYTNDIEDVAQETFIKAYRALPNFRGDSAFYTWLYRIAVNTAKNHLVSGKRKPKGIDADIEEAEEFDSAIGLRENENPENLAAVKELEACITDTIAGLSDELRAAITLRELEGMSYEEIADVLACPVGTVRSRIFRAREAVELSMQPLLSS